MMAGTILIIVLLVGASAVWSFEAAKMRADMRDKETRKCNREGD